MNIPAQTYEPTRPDKLSERNISHSTDNPKLGLGASDSTMRSHPQAQSIPQTIDANDLEHTGSVPDAVALETHILDMQNYEPHMKAPLVPSPSGATWLTPHLNEHQKHNWHYKSLGMGDKHVHDEWGFSSANVSRSHSPCREKGEGKVA